MENLKLFYTNEPMREEVKNFLHETLKQVALEKLFKGEDAKAVASAKEVVDEAFNRLSDIYEKKEKLTITNQAI